MPSFDIVSQVDMQEVRNAVDQSMREVVNRYDFKGTDTRIELTDEGITVESASDHRVEAAIDVLKTKLVKRKVSLKSIAGGEIKPVGGSRSRADFTLNQGIAQDDARALSKQIRDMKLKAQAQIQGDQLRVQAKKRDDLQTVIAEIKALDFHVPLQFVNYRD
ncbi:MAG: YajQ family cyclic di-GMP-binding protein [Acidimicrobiia bacterium]|nr:YajQ family cyclic di-GMP-binding protein [Acidimicrobiia bacterium]